jgi:hypothetical protein
MVPRGRLELPLLSKTDFESAASTGSATGAQWRRSIGMVLRLVNPLALNPCTSMLSGLFKTSDVPPLCADGPFLPVRSWVTPMHVGDATV